MKRLAVCFFVACIISMFTPDIVVQAETDGQYEYIVLEDETVKITKYLGEESEIEIPGILDGRKVTVLGESLFENNSNIVSVQMEEGILEVEEKCFYNCSELITVELSKTLCVIGNEAFCLCGKLVNMTLPVSVTSIGEKAFWYTQWLRNERDKNLGFKFVQQKMEDGSYLSTSVVICNPVIINDFFLEASGWIGYTGGTKEEELKVVQEYVVSKNVKEVCSYAFYTPFGNQDTMPSGNDNVVSVVFENPDTMIAPAAFYGCERLEKVELPANLKTIKELTFAECSNLKSLEIPDGVTTIADNAFLNCTSLQTIELPASLEKLGKNAFAGIVGEDGESGLTVTVPEDVDVSNLGLENIINIQYITINVAEGSQAYIYLQQCENVVINTYPSQQPDEPNSGDEQRQESEGDEKATEEPTTEELTTEKPTTEKPITEEVVKETARIGKIYTRNNLKYKVTSASNVTVVGVTKKNAKKITIPSKVTILNQSFKVTAIGKKAFKKHEKLTTVTIGNNVKTIGDEAFMKCAKLKKIIIGKNVKTIGKKVFYGDKKLKEMTFKGSKVTKIGKKAMSGVSGVKVKVPTNKAKKKYIKLLRKAK